VRTSEVGGTLVPLNAELEQNEISTIFL